jgi:hypothetical protein
VQSPPCQAANRVAVQIHSQIRNYSKEMSSQHTTHGTAQNTSVKDKQVIKKFQAIHNCKPSSKREIHKTENSYLKIEIWTD